ncbi:MAG: 6-carboxytetrahydropterin synthase QueD [Deltaproteobacteria bacterium HGW-Deltaproteobacteria-14]|jgi:6-pyruvoyltetrahydropterin/6-carboxytetrahydropterin synthase|nr:MAG: 6-carboxytetrahydropterin synthase QueD [Deltaproteobacteria bacterium HGW-Deltaproteobacteria-14]
MELSIAHRFRFEAARRLPRLPADHPCARVHGHGFEVELEVVGPIDPELGWVTDYAALAAVWGEVAGELDHAYLNEVPGLENPTSELIAVWLWGRLVPRLPGLAAVSVMETPTTRATVRRERRG